MIPYVDFIERRRAVAPAAGRVIDSTQLHASLKPFQRQVTAWACEVGRPAVWADTGLGKTRMQLEWSRLMGERSLIATPLAVAEQTVEESRRIGVDARYVRHPEDAVGSGVFVTNFEMVPGFNPGAFDAFALDESSILKQSDGKTRATLIDWASAVPYRSSWSATPGPNDPEELTNQAEFLGHMTRTNMLAAYFVHDQDGWRVKGHAYAPMVEWMSSWAIALRRPSDLGYSDDGYILPGLEIVPELVEVHVEPGDGELFATTIGGVGDRARVRRETLAARVERAASLVTAEPDEPWLLWCGLNDEAEALAAALPGAVNVHGALSPEEKARALLGFARGDVQTLITKPKIASLGLNFQRCARMAFVGLSDSYEQYYQGLRRCYRYGQTRVVRAHIIVSELEDQIARNVKRKEAQANRLLDGLVAEWGRKAA
ncbi:Helicase conserved C-terminal domain-containing protein [Microbacterium hydrothermale]|uniref:helicase-related protein n=1 Tax=Microbacterium hydrothermale TaxID=857427 RepID=UPI002226B3F0|nr:DEAD/DEAH box helicase [Microbacterium hydrothermale]MCW2165091.1 Helicase conserved C-terminal domain-containing protein [Microbacterium hydrothermale]